MYCKKCGAWCDDDAAFCSICGNRLQEVTPASLIQNQISNASDSDSVSSRRPQAEQMLSPGMETEEPYDSAEEEEPEETHRLHGITIAVIVLAAVLAVVMMTVMVMVIRNNGGSTAEEPQETETPVAHSAQISAFRADSCNATAVVLTIEGSGYQPDGWRIILTPESGAAITKETTERSILIEGLTPQTNYTAVLKTTDDTALAGTTECRFTTSDYTVLTAFQPESVTSDQAVLDWSWTGTEPVFWSVAWNGTDGSSGSLDTADSSCTITGLAPDITYTVTLSCDSLQSTELSEISITPEKIAVGGWSITELSSTSISIGWTYSGTENVPGEWILSYTYGVNAAPVTMSCTSNSGVIVNDLLPSTTYTFTVVSADGAEVDSEKTVCTTSDGGTFEEYGCHNVSMTLYAVTSAEDALDQPTTVLSASQLLAYAIEADYDYSFTDKTVSTLYIVRKSTGEPLFSYASSRSWSGSWETARHTGTFPDYITEPGNYTLEAYFNGSFLVSQSFTVE